MPLPRLGISTGELAATVGLFIAATVGAWLWQQRQRRADSEQHEQGPLRVVDLRIYPIKSCAGFSVAAASFGRLGFKHDRQFMIVDTESGRMITARDAPQLVQIVPTLDEQAGTMSVSFALEPSWDSLTVPLQPPRGAAAEGARRRVHLFDNELDAVSMGEAAGAWFTRVAHWHAKGAAPPSANALARRYELVSILGEQEHERPLPAMFDFAATDPAVAHKRIAAGAFTDAYPFLMATRASLRALNKWTEPKGRHVEMEAFRPNVIVAGGGMQAWDEDTWRSVEIGGQEGAASSGALRFTLGMPCGRCVLPNVIPSTGTRAPCGEPLLSLRRHRQMLSGVPEAAAANMAEGAYFGQYLIQMQPAGTMRVGDLVHVKERKARGKLLEFAPGQEPVQQSQAQQADAKEE